MVKHYIPTTLEEALELLDYNHLEIIAGGTDLMVQRRTWANTLPKFKDTINIFNLQELNYIVNEDKFIRIGATTPMSDILTSGFTPELLRKAIYEVASPALRNLATIAGNIGNASPAGDTLPILYTLNAGIKIISKNNERIVPIKEVIIGPRKTILKPNELIAEIIIPKSSFTKTQFTKVGGRKADAISKVSFTAAVHVENNIITDIRFAFGAVGPTVVRNEKLEQKLINKTTKELHDFIPEIIDDYSEIITPIDDQRSNKEYRKQVALNMLLDFLLSI